MNTTLLNTYNIANYDEQAAADIARICDLRPLTACILTSRGVRTPKEAQRFLAPSLDTDWHDPYLIPGMREVVDKVEQVIRQGGRILVFGDFDVDGITATTVSVRGLRALGADAHGLIPHRYNEGYALSRAAVERGLKLNPDLIMTVDCGISCGDEVAWMLEEGIDVCVTDHHEAGEKVPQGIPMTDPKIDHNCLSCDLAGVGVALKLLCALGERLGKPNLWRELTDFAALGTVADLMPLTQENRALVADGIRRINNNPRPCISELAAICGVKPEEISSNRLSFSLIPRLNASGRMGDATVALDLLLSDDVATAQTLAADLNAVNDERRRVEAELTKLVEEKLAEDFHDEPVIVVAGEGWHEGVKGIVASRIARKYQRPALIFTVVDGVARGSGRTFGDVNLFELASSCSELFSKFGGHAAAIGITLDESRLQEFSQRVCTAMEGAVATAAPKQAVIDAIVRLEECDVEGFQELERLQPFGNSNPMPLLAAENVFLENRGAVGKTGNHLRFMASDGVCKVAGIWFGVEDIEHMVNCESVCHVVFEPGVDEWQGRYTAKLMTKNIIPVELGGGEEAPSEEQEQGDFFDELFSRSVEICDTGDYAGITQAESFNTKAVGVTFEDRQSLLSGLEPGTELRLQRQPDNEFDSNAIAVTLLDGTQLGYLNRALAGRLAPVMDAGESYSAAVSAVTGGPAANDAAQSQTQDPRQPGPLGVRDPGVVDRSYGVNILVRRDAAFNAAQQDVLQARQQLTAARERWAQVAPDQLEQQLKQALIGEHSLHAAQRETLDHLAQGDSTLAIMATGRGKSLIFHMHAAKTALLKGKASVFVYPLRALVADQAFHLQDTYAKFGLTVKVLTGETENDAREDIYRALQTGEVNVILTTPEFLSIHAQRFAQTGKVGFVVVDEAHHIGQSKAGNRPAYLLLKQALEDLGCPLVLAVTATAGDEECKLICNTLSIKRLVLDASMRENLHLDDRRDLRDRDNYLARIVASGSKVIAYVNSRDQSIQLTRKLRHRLPAMAQRIGFYNAGLPKADRKRIEAAFREGELMAIISTSAFGEGIDIPDVEHVILFHMPFSAIEFNQMAGRAGRDGRDATVHLLFGYGDSRINEKILGSGAPERDCLVALYRVLRDKGARALEAGEQGFSCPNAQLADEASRQGRMRLDEQSVSSCVGIFKELGFLETTGYGVARRIIMNPSPQKMDLMDSVRYQEGLDEKTGFAAFKQWVLGAEGEELLRRFNRPILPQNPGALL